MAKTKVCEVTYDAVPRRFMASDSIYTTDLQTHTGVGPADATAADEPLYDTGELLRVGALMILSVKYTYGSGNRGSADVFCTPAKVNDALLYFKGSGKTINGHPVTSASIKRKSFLH